jgi:predicted ATPase
MRITHLKVWNWRNFLELGLDVPPRLFVVGPNASGKSNLLDAVRFLRDIAGDGGGFQAAVQSRGGLHRVRNLNARNRHHGQVGISLALGDDDDEREWEYELEFGNERAGKHRPQVRRETVRHHGRLVLNRPDSKDKADADRQTQTALEQVTANLDFRPVVELLQSVQYLHLVPQVIRDPERRTSVLNDPFGGDFLSRIARTPTRTKEARLRRINDALRLAVPQLESLDMQRDDDGAPHLVAVYKHWRPNGAQQNERDFSDGTLRLIGLLWALQEGGRSAGPALLEEPELSLHSAVVSQLPGLLHRAVRNTSRQILLSTHAPELLRDQGIGLDEVVLLTPEGEGTAASKLVDLPDVRNEVEGLGMSVAEVVAARTAPPDLSRMGQLSL